jgi:hypothetical protein
MYLFIFWSSKQMIFKLVSKKVVNNFFFSLKTNFSEFSVIIDHCKFIITNLYKNSSVEFVARQTYEFTNNLCYDGSTICFKILVFPLWNHFDYILLDHD